MLIKSLEVPSYPEPWGNFKVDAIILRSFTAITPNSERVI